MKGFYFIYLPVAAILTYFIFVYRRKKKPQHQQLFHNFPKNGDYIRLTWLPNPKNNPLEKSCYIGSEGVVEDMKEDGSFCLRMESGATLIVGKKYKWTQMETDFSSK